jgi:hypothetical protein
VRLHSVLEVGPGAEQVVGPFRLDFVEVVDGLGAGLDGGGDHAGLLRLADGALGVADGGREDIVQWLGVTLGNLQLLRRPMDDNLRPPPMLQALSDLMMSTNDLSLGVEAHYP